MTYDVPRERGTPASISAPGEALAWLGGIVFTLSAFMGWYTGLIDGLRVSVVGWDTGLIGKLVVVVGLLEIVVLALRIAGVALPPTVPTGLVIAGLGAVGTIIVLVRLLQIPDDYSDFSRAFGIWVSLLSAILLIAAGLLKASDEL